MNINDLDPNKYKVVSFGGSAPTATTTSEAPTGMGGLKGFGMGAAKGLSGTVFGLGNLVGQGSSLVGKVIPGNDPFQRYGAAVKSGYEESKSFTQANSFAEKAGKFTEQVGEFVLPLSKVSKATQGMSFLGKLGARAGTSAGVATAQSGRFGPETLVAGGVEAALPVAGKFIAKPAAALAGRLFKGVGTGLSGMSSSQLEAILKDPKAAKSAVESIRAAGGSQALKQSAEVITNGIKQIEGSAKQQFAKALETLEGVKVPIESVRNTLSNAWRNARVKVGKSGFSLSDTDFADDMLSMKKGKEIVNYINGLKDLDGKSLRQAMDFVESRAFGSATSDSKNAFNQFVRSTVDALKDSVSDVSPVLKEANLKYSEAKGLSEAIQSIFGKVKFKNAKELLNTTKRLEGLFKQGEYSDELINDFLGKVGVEPTAFRAGEAARQVGQLAEKTNTIGTNPFEIIRGITAAIVPPKAVRDFAIQFGLAENVVKEMVEKLSPATRGVIIRLLIGDEGQNPQD